MSEKAQHPESQPDHDLPISGNFYQDLAAEVQGRINLEKQHEISKQAADAAWEHDQAGWRRIEELQQQRMWRRLGEDFNALTPQDQFERLVANIEALAQQISSSQDEEPEASGYREGLLRIRDSMERMVVDTLQKIDQEDDKFVPEKLIAIFDARVGVVKEPELTLEQARHKFLYTFSTEQGQFMKALVKSRGPEAGFAVVNEALENSLAQAAEVRKQKEQAVIDGDTSGDLPEAQGKKLTMSAIEEDPDYQSIRSRHPRPQRLEEIAQEIAYTRFLGITMNDSQEYWDRPESVSMQREYDALEAEWLVELRQALNPILDSRYEELASIWFVPENKNRRLALQANQSELPNIKLGPTIIPVQAALEGNITPNWTIMNGKTGFPNSTTTIKDTAFKMLTGKFLENQENGLAEAYRADSGQVVYCVELGFHRMAAAKMLGRRTRVTDVSTRDPELAKELQVAVL